SDRLWARDLAFQVVERAPDASDHGRLDAIGLEAASQAEQRLKSLDLVAALRDLRGGWKIAEQCAGVSGVEADSAIAGRDRRVENGLPRHRHCRRQGDDLQVAANPDDLYR